MHYRVNFYQEDSLTVAEASRNEQNSWENLSSGEELREKQVIKEFTREVLQKLFTALSGI